MKTLITNARTSTHAPAAPSPGPWHAQGRYIVPYGDGPSIGHATILKAPSLKKQPDYDAQGYINARLMAAAPSMYDALVKTLALLQDGDAEEYEAAALENLITDILVNLESPI
jgi:hypothetical protein